MARNEIPDALVRAIHAGECLAFVGAGFSAAGDLPQWHELLTRIAEHASVPLQVREFVAQRVAQRTAHAFDEAAQVLEDRLTHEVFVGMLREQLAGVAPGERMARRIELLRGIPFRAILTLNFDGFLEGETPGADAYRAVLRPQQHEWWTRRFWGANPDGPKLLKLHGALDEPQTIVFTRRGYRERLYGSPAYMTFLRSALANHTILYLGFSFADAYLNELRSEILALLGQGAGSHPIAYAVLNDVSAIGAEHLRRTEGVEVLSYDSRNPPGFAGFDAILNELHERTNPVLRMGRMLAGKRILWVDPNPGNNAAYVELFARLARRVDGESCTIELEPDAPSALARMNAAPTDSGFDLVVTHWGRSDTASGSTAEQLLSGMRKSDLRAPVIVFSTSREFSRRKRVAQALGAHGYYSTTAGLLRAIERIFSEEPEAQ